MFFNAELEAELRRTGKLQWQFLSDSDREHFFVQTETERVHHPYDHTPSALCPEKGLHCTYAQDQYMLSLLLHVYAQDVDDAGPLMGTGSLHFRTVCFQSPTPFQACQG